MAHVAPGSVIITDSWAAYEGLDQLDGYNYKVIDNCQAPGNQIMIKPGLLACLIACLLAYPRTPWTPLK